MELAAKRDQSSSSEAWIALGMLCSVGVLNFLSRQLPAIVAKPVQELPAYLDCV